MEQSNQIKSNDSTGTTQKSQEQTHKSSNVGSKKLTETKKFGNNKIRDAIHSERSSLRTTSPLSSRSAGSDTI